MFCSRWSSSSRLAQAPFSDSLRDGRKSDPGHGARARDGRSALQRIRELTGNYQAPADGCASFKALYDGLARLETDFHHHIHKENNILFPRAAVLESALMSAKA